MLKTDNLVTKDYLDKRLDELKNELIEIKDEIVGEIKASRDDSDVHQFQHQELNDTIENHEARLQKLEKPG